MADDGQGTIFRAEFDSRGVRSYPRTVHDKNDGGLSGDGYGRAPNIMLLVAEDAGRHHGCYGSNYAHTPNLDRLAAQGMLFTNAFSTAPVCAPSRCTMVTGQYPWSLGTHHMRSVLRDPPRLYTQEMRDAGYYVNWSNKTDFNFEPPKGFADECTEWTENLAARRLPDQPKFLYRNFVVTHESTMWSRPHRGGGRLLMRQQLSGLLRPEQHHDPADVPVPEYLPDIPEVRQHIAWYFDALSIQDAEVGQVLDALDASGEADRTIVIYLSDHGRGLPREKRWCYDAGLHLPLIVRWPGALAPGSVCEELVSWVDLAPTILALAGVPIPDSYQGQVFLGPDKAPQREYIFAGRDRMGDAYDQQRVARDSRWHYIRNTFPQLPYAQRSDYLEYMDAVPVMRRMAAQGQLSGSAAVWMSPTKAPEELYDAQDDPEMIHNLATDPARMEKTLARLRSALDEHLRTVGDLGQVPERELIERGLVKDVLPGYRELIEPLPPEQRLGLPRTVLEMHEAQAVTG